MKGRGFIEQIANTHWITEEAREFQKNIYFYFIEYANAFDFVDHKKRWKILKEIGVLDNLTSDQIRSVAQSCPTLRPHESQHTRPPCPSPTPGVHPNSSIESVMPSSHLILCRLLLLLLPIPLSIWVFSNESTLCMR